MTHRHALNADHPAVTLAREVLAIDTSAIGGNIIVDGVDVRETLIAAQSLARAVIELTAQLDAERFAHANTAVKVKNVEALADRLDNEAAYEASRGDTWDATCIRAEARRIRRALNGENA